MPAPDKRRRRRRPFAPDPPPPWPDRRGRGTRPASRRAPPVTVMLPSRAYVDRAGQRPGDAWSTTRVVDASGASTGVISEEPVPYVALTVPGTEGRVAEQRRVRVADGTRDRHARPQPVPRRCLAEARRSTAGRRAGAAAGTPKASSSSASQAAVAQVEQLRAGGIGRVAGVNGAAGEVPQQPAVDRAGAQLAALRRGDRHRGSRRAASASCVAENSGSIASPVRASTSGCEASRAQLVAERRRAAALPDDHRADGPPGRALPDERPTRAGW